MPHAQAGTPVGVFDHVTTRASDRGASERFYETVLDAVGIPGTYSNEQVAAWRDFGVCQTDRTHPVTHGLHVAFAVPSRDHVDRFWQVGARAGYRDDGELGPRPEYGDDYYGGFLLDHDGNSAEAVHHDSLRTGGLIDHLWIRVANVAASRAFYMTIARHAGFEMRFDSPERARFRGSSGSFSILAGAKPTEHLHLAFRAADRAGVDAFHAAATGAGHRDHGGTGERPAYGGAYYAAYVLDPDGNNVEVVCRDGG